MKNNKKIVTIIIALVALLLITLFVFEGTNFYKASFTPTTKNFIGFFVALVLVILIIFYIVKLLEKIKKK